MLDDTAEAALPSTGFGKGKIAQGAVCIVVLVAISLAWRLTPLKESVDFAAILSWQQSLKDHPAALFWVVGAYLIGGLVLFPVMVLNVATIVTFGPVLGNVYAFAGWLCSAVLGFAIARVMGRKLVQKLARSKLHQVLHQAARHGFLTVLSMRILPIAPFTMVNLFVGASGIRFADFFFATVVGRIPGIVTVALFGVQLENFMRGPNLKSSVLLALTIFLIPLSTAWLCKRFAARDVRHRDVGES